MCAAVAFPAVPAGNAIFMITRGDARQTGLGTRTRHLIFHTLIVYTSPRNRWTITHFPRSSMTHAGAPAGEINFKGQLGRMNSLRSEPADAPLSASRFFVVDQSNTLYILDKAS